MTGISCRLLLSAMAASAIAVACGGSILEPGGGGAGSSSGSTGGSSSGSGAGSTSGSSGGGSSGSGSTSGSSSGGVTTGCPTTPFSSQSCTPDGLACEWGSSNVLDCDLHGTCNGGVWLIMPLNPGGLDCGGGPPIACPASYASVPVGSVCPTQGGYCDYPEGRCACEVFLGGPAIPGDASFDPYWYCQSPQTGCPQPRPRLGSTCNQEGQTCDYGGCGQIPGGNSEQCSGGVWVSVPTPCPL